VYGCTGPDPPRARWSSAAPFHFLQENSVLGKQAEIVLLTIPEFLTSGNALKKYEFPDNNSSFVDLDHLGMSGDIT
jgi:hypothetical protein